MIREQTKTASIEYPLKIFLYVCIICRIEYNLIGFEIMGVQAQDTSPNVGIKNGPSISHRPLMVSLKGKPETRAQFAPLKRWQPKEFVLGENTQSSPIEKVGYFPIIAPQLSLINRFKIRKENLLPTDRNIVSSSNYETCYSISSSN